MHAESGSVFSFLPWHKMPFEPGETIFYHSDTHGHIKTRVLSFEDGVYQLEKKKNARPDKVSRECPQGGFKVEVAAQGGVKVEESQVGSSQGGGAQEEFSKFIMEQCPVDGVRELLRSKGAAC